MKAWILAMRLYSLPGAAMPVALSMIMSWIDLANEGRVGDFSFVVMILSFLFAFAMQIDANIINDYFDFIRGNDDEKFRMGPKRACVEGWVTLPAMRWAIALTTIFSAIIGLPLAFYGGWKMIIVGILCIIGAFLYTTHLSYKGLGDVLCFVFFGLVPVGVPYYIQTGQVYFEVLLVGLSAGVVIDAMMMANNYRDIPNDIQCGKRTLFVMLGQKISRYVFVSVAPVAIVLLFPWMLHQDMNYLVVLLPLLLYFPFHIKAVRVMYELVEGPELNIVLALSARNIVFYGVSVAVGMLLGSI